MQFQIRDTDSAVIARLEGVLDELGNAATTKGLCAVAVQRLRTGKPALMDEGMQAAVEAASASHATGQSIRMLSGAGHDAQMLATVMPAGMLFVPSIARHLAHAVELDRLADCGPGNAAPLNGSLVDESSGVVRSLERRRRERLMALISMLRD